MSFRLNDGVQLPPLGFGTYPNHGGDSRAGVRSALELGYRLLDTAMSYGNERQVGLAVRDSGIPRDEIRITSKLPGRHHGRDGAIAAIESSLRELGVDYLDLYLIHWPLPQRGLYVETWEAMVSLRERGLVRSIGVSNFTDEHLERIITATGVVPAVNQVEMHPYFPQAAARDAHRTRGIVTQAWSPLGRNSGLLGEAVLADIADARGASTAQVVLAWVRAHDALAIPMSSDPVRQEENLQSLTVELTTEDIERIDALASGRIWRQDPDEYEEF